MKTLIAIAVSLTSVLAANAAGYDYEVEYVKSTHGSCVKTDLIPEPGLTFKMDLMFEGPFNQIFGGKFDMARNTTAFFGQEDEKDADGWLDDPRSAANLNRIYPEGHKRPIEHWSMVRTGTRYADYIYSDLPEARKTTQWQYMQEQIKQGMKRRGGKPYDY